MKTTIPKVVGSLTTETLTKELGEELISRCENERKIKERHVKHIIDNIIFGGWNNSSIISVCEDGELLDGQHRLHALKELGWPRIRIQICTYKKKDVTQSLRSSFNVAVKQSVADTMRMVYKWDNVTKRCGVCSSLYRAFISDSTKVICDHILMLQVDKAFGEEIAEFIGTGSSHIAGRRVLSCDIRAAFAAMRIVHGPSKAGMLQRLRNDVENRLNCDSNNCITARINDYAYSTVSHGGEKRTSIYRVCIAIDMAMRGKRVCKSLDKFNDEEVEEFGKIIREEVQKKYDVDF